MTEPTLLWHDYETFGTSPQKDLPCQFAAIRTDSELNEIGKPINIVSQIANDYLPHPQACLVTGITPQQTLRDGMIEAEFADKVFAAMSEPNTCVAGYNSIRFDDEVSRYLFYRNFYDPYSREWRNGNSRWDIIDLARACYALRPDGIQWPTREDGAPSFKLEHLTAANGIDHGDAHDALADVRATIALARLIRKHQPKLYDYAFSLRSKQAVLKQFDFSRPSVLLHVSSRLPAHSGCSTWVMPVGMHPNNPNAVVVLDLSRSTDLLLNGSVEEIRQALYARQDELDDPASRPGLKLIYINRSPFVTTAKAMTEANAERLGLDREACLANFKLMSQHPEVWQKLLQVYDEPHPDSDDDADHALYSGGFLNDEDRRWCERVREADPYQLPALADDTHNPRLRTLLFRYRARNFPHTLTADEMQRWQHHRQARLTDAGSPASITMENYLLTLESLAQAHADNPDNQAILRALYQYAENL
ncbi:exodeoxyribonuclease I [Alteromonas sp. ASW11-19]|uniref:Exodeoxyribonuclease I n=1 Tax=Alteromonas salexigens TaxID=2982530 RepID=A0ABT2VN83_9ALTE|nr:exodeoxyribonuclease I [Alteromonas salexigens]MCU7553933.1 exodeoxyribonuclease I [Alteromonas salexigens]